MSAKLKHLGKNQKIILDLLRDGKLHKTKELARKCGTRHKHLYRTIRSLRFVKGINIICVNGAGYAMGSSESIPLTAHRDYSKQALGQAIGAETRLMMERPDFKKRLQLENKRGIKDKATYIACRSVFKRVAEHAVGLEMADLAPTKQLKS
jgi:hypothetical protein